MSRTRSAQPVDHFGELARAFHVAAGDLEANRLGELGPGQAQRMVRSGYVNLALAAAMAAGLLALVMAVAERPFEPVQIILTLVLVAALLTVGAVYLVKSTQAVAIGRVDCFTGPVSVVMRGRAGWYLTVEEQSFKFPVQRWHVQNGATYHVYVAPRAKRIVAMEPAWT
ncbi:MAG TPA: hypothetical protein VGO78_25260 [Acidimicrobiales bacterium]|jgi:hypothetical protein|nr:hypothetical protein [Acidimicrobiales bacterium]